MNYAVWDIQNGTILKLSENRQVTHAILGFEKLTPQRIKAIYGDPPLYLHLKWPATCWQLEQIEGAHWVMLGNFDSYKLPIICQIVSMIKSGAVKKTFKKFAFDLFDVSSGEFVYWTSDVHPIANYGTFYPEIVKNPERFIQPQPELKSVLSELKSNGVLLFLATNSHTEYLDVTMSTTLGKNWRKFFDILLINCRKPLFQRAETPFHTLNIGHMPDDHKGYKIASVDEIHTYLQTGRNELLEGNSKLLTEYFQYVLCKKDVSVAFFGDDYLSDIHATYEFDLTLQATDNQARWYPIAVIDEMTKFFNDSSPLHSKNLTGIPHDGGLWGSSFFTDDVYKYKIVRNGVIRNFFVTEMSKVTRYAVPSISSLKWILQDNHPLTLQIKEDVKSYLPTLDMQELYTNISSSITAHKNLAAQKAYALYNQYSNTTYLSQQKEQAKQRAYEIYSKYSNQTKESAYDLYNYSLSEGKKMFEIKYDEVCAYYRNNTYIRKKQERAKRKALRIFNSISNSTHLGERKKRAKQKAYEVLKSIANSAIEHGIVDKKSIVQKMSAWRDYIPASIMPAGSLQKLLDSRTQTGHVRWVPSATQKQYTVHVEDQTHILRPVAPHTHTLVFLHGLNGCGAKYENLFLDPRVMALMPPSCKIVLPTAPMRPVALNGGQEMRSWYDVRSFSNLPEENLDEFLKASYSQEDILDSVNTVIAILKKESEELGSSQNVFLGGFSQGCVVSVATYLTMDSDIKLGGVFGIGGGHCYVVDWAKIDIASKKQIPLKLYHGGKDPVIPASAATRSYQELKQNGLDHLKLQVEPGLQHTCSFDALTNLSNFIKKVIDPEQQKYGKQPSLTVDAIAVKPIILKHDHFRPWVKRQWKKKTKLLQRWEILLITRKNEPFKGKFAFPGGFVGHGEAPEVSVLRELKEECSIEGKHAEFFMVAGDPNRDPRKHVISLVYQVTVSMDSRAEAADDAATANWYNLQDVVRNDDGKFDMAFDHRKIFGKFLRKRFNCEQTLIALEKYKASLGNTTSVGGSQYDEYSDDEDCADQSDYEDCDDQMDGEDCDDQLDDGDAPVTEDLEERVAMDKAYLQQIQDDLDELDKQMLDNEAKQEEMNEQNPEDEHPHEHGQSTWPILEASARVFTSYMHSCGMSKKWSFEEVYGIEERELLELQPRPILAVIANIKRLQPSEIIEYNQGPFFISQSAQLKNACGLIACLHAVYNNLPNITLEEGLLQQLHHEMSGKSPQDKAKILQSMKQQISADIISKFPTPAPVPTHHFVTYILDSEQRLIQLNGNLDGPIVIKPYCEDILYGTIDHLSSQIESGEISKQLDVFSLGFNTEYLTEEGWPQIQMSGQMITLMLKRLGLDKWIFTENCQQCDAIIVDVRDSQADMIRKGQSSFFMRQTDGLPSILVCAFNAIFNNLGDTGIQLSYGSLLQQYISTVHDKTPHQRGLTLFGQEEILCKWREFQTPLEETESQHFVGFIINKEGQLLELDGRLPAPAIIKDNCQNLQQDVLQEIEDRKMDGRIEVIGQILYLSKTNDIN